MWKDGKELITLKERMMFDCLFALETETLLASLIERHNILLGKMKTLR